MSYMKQPSIQNQANISITKPKAKKQLTDEKVSASATKKTDVSSKNEALTKPKTALGKTKLQNTKTSAPKSEIRSSNSKKNQSSAIKTIKSESEGTKVKISAVKNRDKTAKSQSFASSTTKQIKTIANKPETEKTKKNVELKKGSGAKLQPSISAKKNPSKNPKIVKTEQKPNQSFNKSVEKIKAAKSQTLTKTKSSVELNLNVVNNKIPPKNSEIKSKIVKAKLQNPVGKKPVVKVAGVKQNDIQKSSVSSENKLLNSKISKIAKVEDQKIVAVHLVKKLKLPAGETAPTKKKLKQQKVLKVIELEPEVPVLPALKPKPKKAKAISSAVFRGAKNRYDFTVFPLDAVFEDVPAIYIISRRVVDKSKKAHHALICIGQTQSLLDELKKHKKDRRTKKFAANSISLLREENEIRRLKIETDLKAAHAIRCLYA